jgi:phosphoribosylaminoimidazolecarboxamide formyltransferase / IMP cyclohydrolase
MAGKTPNLSITDPTKLRYGENPHQQGWVWRTTSTDPFALHRFRQLQGKELSYNNYLDIDAAVAYLSFLGQKQPACIIIKHTNACGAASSSDLMTAFKKAWDGDSLAAFGSIISVNRKVDAPLAQTMLSGGRFFEVLVCPGITKEALGIFAEKDNLRVLVNEHLRDPRPDTSLKIHQIRGGILVQEADTYKLKKKDIIVPTKKEPTDKQTDDLLFAWEVCRVSKANCIVVAKNRQLISSGVGQQDRRRCCELAVSKGGKRVKGTVAASDAFFPFKDGPEVLISAGVKAIIQPGGSIRDQEIIDLCDKSGIAMVFTGHRCFRH